MNALEKALLIKELHLLTAALEHQALSFYEIAKTKKRIKEIFALCDEPIFQKQLLSYKALTEPQSAAYAFAAGTPFAQSFRGYFNDDHALEKQLYLKPESGWGFMHQPPNHWQIWLIPAPQRTALISDWGNFEDNYAWMLAMQKQYHCLSTDAELDAQALQAEEQPACAQPEHMEAGPTPHPDSQLTEPSEPPAPQTQPSLAEVPAGRDVLLETSSEHKEELPEAVLPPEAPEPQSILFHQMQGQLHALTESADHPLYRVVLPPDAKTLNQSDIALHAEHIETWQTQPVYIAEQINAQGQFIQHLILLGAADPAQATELCQLFVQLHARQLASLYAISLHALEAQDQTADTLFKCCYELAKPVWQQEHYQRFIPAQAIHTQKFIQFDEQEADFSTPILLLEERQKVRIIHGEKRLALADAEQAYPYLILHRRHGLNWQMIQAAISALPKPVNVLELYNAIQNPLSGTPEAN